jgi:hypothetical protein
VIGRSGGGLFSADGQLIGVCNLADPQDNEGIYAALPLLHANLDKIAQSRLYQRNAAPSAAAQASAAAAPAGLAAALPDMASQMPRPPLDASGPAAVAAAAAVSQAAPLIATTAAALDDDTEVICIVRSKRDPRGPSQVIYLDRPSRTLLGQLAQESQPPRTGGPVMLEASRNSLPPSRATSETSSPVVRGQTN